MKHVLTLLALAVPSLAQAADPAPEGSMGMVGQLVFLGGFLVIFYFLLWRPQAKRQKEHKNLMEAIAAGDEVVTSGGILGKVNKVSDDFVVLEVLDGVQFPVQKAAVTAVLPKGTMKALKD